MKKLIIAEDTKSFPEELHVIVAAKLNQIPFDELQRLRKTIPSHERGVDNALEKWFGVWRQYDLYQQTLIPLFNQYDILCYHATRIGTRDSILLNGLRTNMHDYFETLKSFLLSEGVPISRINLALNAIQKEYQRKYKDDPHQLCFFTSLISFRNCDGSAGYDQFCETVGGELAKWALEEQCPDILEILRTKGIPVVVEFTTPFSSIADYHKDSLIFPFVAHVVSKELWELDYLIEADSSLIGEVPPDRILRLIDSDTI